MATLALLVAATLSANPGELVLGKDASADLQLRAPSGAKVTFSTSVGTVSGVQRQGDTVRARFNAPPLRVPSVALILAQIDDGGDRELCWISIPLSGSDTMVIETKPGARVEATVEGKVLGKGPAGEDGTVRLPMVVPPGVRHATLKITDKLGNSNEKPLDLAPPPFSRLRLAARSEAASTGSALEVEIFVVKPGGEPDDDARVALSAPDGETRLRKRVRPGVYLAEYVPETKSGTVQLEAKANGQLATLDVPVRAAPSGSRSPFWRTTISSQGPWSVSVGLLGGYGGAFNGGSAGSVLAEVAMRIESYPVELLLDVGGSFFSAVSQYASVPALAEQADPGTWLGQVGVRAGYEVMRRLDLHGSVAFGLQHQRVTTTLPLNLGQIEDSALSPRLALALGANYRIGPGRALAQVQLDFASKGVAGLAGSTSGVQGMIGYLVAVR